MLNKLVRKWVAAGLVAAGALSSSAIAQEPPAPPPAQAVAPIRVTLQGGEEEVYALLADEAPPPSEYWIGIALGELPALAKKQLKLEHGLVVEDVLPDSPAAKAEFNQHDVLVQAGEKPLHEPADILKAVEEAKEKELTIAVIRGGDRMTLKVTPAKRPKPAPAEGSTGEAPAPSDLRKLSLRKLEEALAELKGEAGDEPLGLYFARPGVVAARVKHVELPKNMSVIVTKDGDGPAKLHVKRDNKEFATTVDKLNDLPDDVRSQVEQLLGKAIHPMLATRARALVGGPATPYTPRSPAAPGVVPPAIALPQPPQPAPTVARLHAYRVASKDEGLEAKVDLILKKLESLENKSLEQLQDEVKRLRKDLDELRNK